MNSKAKKILIPFILMIVFNIAFSSDFFWELGIENPHVGLLFVFGLLFGPYGALGAVSANIILDFLSGATIIEIIPSEIISFGVSIMAYKLWYSHHRDNKITKPRLDNTYHLTLFLSSLLICGLVYSVAHGCLKEIFIGGHIAELETVSYFLNFINIGFVLGIIGIWISRKIDFIEIPKKSERHFNKKLYGTLFFSLIAVVIISLLSIIVNMNVNILIIETIIIGILLIGYITKPIEDEVESSDENMVIANIMKNFLRITLIIAILGMIVTILNYNYIANATYMNIYLHLMPMLIISDIIIILFFIPGIAILRYIEQKVIKPISSFSKIEGFIKEDEKIESEGLVNVYSKYINEQNEIGTLARSYTELISHNNHYIENIRRIEGKNKRIEAELDIATKIQSAALPTESIETGDFFVDGYSKAAKEVGGDFFDYYMIDDDNLVIVIGDASDKGVPAALLAMISQVMIKQIIKHDRDPSKVLYSMNNQLSERNSQSMFITLWLGIYNRKSRLLRFSNAGHNPPLIREKGKFRYMDIDTGLVIGIIEDFDYTLEETLLEDELVLYTDGITDANNADNEMYGEERLLKFFNEFKEDSNPIEPLLNDIDDFTKDTEPFDDMTLLYLNIK